MGGGVVRRGEEDRKERAGENGEKEEEGAMACLRRGVLGGQGERKGESIRRRKLAERVCMVFACVACIHALQLACRADRLVRKSPCERPPEQFLSNDPACPRGACARCNQTQRKELTSARVAVRIQGTGGMGAGCRVQGTGYRLQLTDRRAPHDFSRGRQVGSGREFVLTVFLTDTNGVR